MRPRTRHNSFGVSISGEILPPTNFSTSWPVALMRSACSMARWSIHTMMSRSACSDGPTGKDRPLSPSTTSEQVASKPMPAICSGDTAACASASFTESQTACQISPLDCSTMEPLAWNSVMSRFADATMRPARSKMPARALPVPTSTPMT
jgi:hypothetical protein